MKRMLRYLNLCFVTVSIAVALFGPRDESGAAIEASSLTHTGPVMVIDVNGSINPATDDFLKTATRSAVERNARLLVIRLNTPGGLITSMQSMVQTILDAPIPVAVYVTPGGASATSAGVFITLSGHIAAMAPGTTIGAAHPVVGSGEDIQGDMRAKMENFAVSFVKAIAEQRGRNVAWAEKAVRESVSITDREALAEKVVDVVAADLPKLLEEINNRTLTVKGVPVTLRELPAAPQETLEMSFKQQVVNLLSDPNIAILLGFGAMLGIGIELYHPGAMLPGIVGVICLILSLTAAQVLPINYGGLALLLLGAIFFVVELFMPTFGMWGIAGLVCFVLGSIYLIDVELVWGIEGYNVSTSLVGTTAFAVGLILAALSYLALGTRRMKVSTGQEGLVGSWGVVKGEFRETADGRYGGRVQVGAEYWNAKYIGSRAPAVNSRVRVQAVEQGMTLIVESSE